MAGQDIVTLGHTRYEEHMLDINEIELDMKWVPAGRAAAAEYTSGGARFAGQRLEFWPLPPDLEDVCLSLQVPSCTCARASACLLSDIQMLNWSLASGCPVPHGPSVGSKCLVDGSELCDLSCAYVSEHHAPSVQGGTG